MSTRPFKGRSQVGTSAFVTVPAVRTRNISVFAAINKEQPLYFKHQNKAFNGEDFIDCCRELKTICVEKGILNPVFILDNARIHHYSRVAELKNELGIELLYLPPYSPFLNPIENCFSKWKNTVLRGQLGMKVNCLD